jgi:hypothetical protein
MDMDCNNKELFISDENFENISPYAKFMICNRNYIFYHKRSGKKLDKWEVFSYIETNQHQQNLLNLNKHLFIEKRKK